MSFIFFFKQKTAYEMRISDWSSDVCSSDLCGRQRRPPAIDAVIRKQECRCHAALADKLGKAEFRNGAPNYRVDTYAANIAQALKQAIDIGRSRGLFEITQPRQRCNAESRVDRKSVVKGTSVSVRVCIGGVRERKKQK